MTKVTKITNIDRRQFVIKGAAAATIANLLPSLTHSARAAAQKFESIYLGLVGNAQPIEDRVTLTLPKLAESGYNIRYTISVDSPMTEDDYVKAIHILAPENPEPRIASFQLTPYIGKAEIAGRLRLAKTQNVTALAQLNNDTFYVARQKIDVAVGGCSG